MSGIDLDAIIAESQRDALPLTLGGVTYELPGEFPLDVLAPFLSEDLDLAGVFTEVMASVNAEDGDGKKFTDLVVDTLMDHPALPLDLVKAAGEALERLLGTEAYAAFWAIRPTIAVVRVLFQQLIAHYGVGLLDFSDSDDSSEPTGEPSKQTSSGSTDSTPAEPGDDQETPADS